ncbi:ArsR/SmtB family transcription factor [Gordonia soli]|uniref:Putative ArsR family transcriptional regulator n=1 Tax=Gordonia soli NBRC 108243 TaxID=1223545 RepID=M0QG03_9ACTN|nr:metalloregulator ArsR/SmtB family transcription factor [Gordonia soli]GAC67359.1 putative ArsR family transcriptional regulator [Gordonia soli NBRC 108243]
MRDSEVGEWATRFALLSDPTRLRLLVEMHADPDLPVAELAQRVGITENAASQSLRALRDQGWVETQRTGRTVHYRVVADAIVHRILHDILGATHSH